MPTIQFESVDMDVLKVLLTGDYWHHDFAELIRTSDYSTTLIPLSKVHDLSLAEDEFSLVVIAQSRRNQFEHEQIERLHQLFTHIPVVMLSGSWCEGEGRSGSPPPGVLRVYWHQWNGRLASFDRQLTDHKDFSWNLPRICSTADRILYERKNAGVNFEEEFVVGVSALTPDRFDMVKDACGAAGLESIWLETLGDGEEANQQLSVICIEANSLTVHLIRRVEEIKEKFPVVPVVALMNFPRKFDSELARMNGVAGVISKPFQLCDLHLAMQLATREAA